MCAIVLFATRVVMASGAEYSCRKVGVHLVASARSGGMVCLWRRGDGPVDWFEGERPRPVPVVLVWLACPAGPPKRLPERSGGLAQWTDRRCWCAGRVGRSRDSRTVSPEGENADGRGERALLDRRPWGPCGLSKRRRGDPTKGACGGGRGVPPPDGRILTSYRLTSASLAGLISPSTTGP